MSPVDRAGSVNGMKLVSVHMVTFSPLSEMKNSKNYSKLHYPSFIIEEKRTKSSVISVLSRKCIVLFSSR